jgi:hypothetical protein
MPQVKASWPLSTVPSTPALVDHVRLHQRQSLITLRGIARILYLHLPGGSVALLRRHSQPVPLPGGTSCSCLINSSVVVRRPGCLTCIIIIISYVNHRVPWRVMDAQKKKSKQKKNVCMTHQIVFFCEPDS